MTMIDDMPEEQFGEAFSLLQGLKKHASRENKRKNLDVLWLSLAQMWKDGHRSFSIADVGRKVEENGGPKTQSLRNDGGHDYRRVIEAFAASVGVVRHLQHGQGRSQLDLAVESLPDPSVRAFFRQIVAENRLYKSQNDQLRFSFKELSVRRPVEHSVSGDSSVAGEVASPTEVLTADEKNLLRRSICPTRFEENGWKLTEHGGVADDAGILVLSPGFMAVLRKLIS